VTVLSLQYAVLEAAAKGFIVLAIVALFSPLFRRQPAALRHALWTSAVFMQFALLLIVVMVPRWSVPLLGAPQWMPVGNGLVASTVSTVADAHVNWWTTAWLIGACAVCIQIIVGAVGVCRLARAARRVNDMRWLAASDRIAGDLGISRRLTLLEGSRLDTPVTWGLTFPVILLPSNAHSWDNDQLRNALLHEMAHVRRLDALTQLLAQIATAVFWFNPLVWWAAQQMRKECEHACDDYVLRSGVTPSRYAEDLLTMVRRMKASVRPHPGALAALAMSHPSEFEERLMAIINPDSSRRPIARRQILGLVSVAALIAVPFAPLTPFRTARAEVRSERQLGMQNGQNATTAITLSRGPLYLERQTKSTASPQRHKAESVPDESEDSSKVTLLSPILAVRLVPDVPAVPDVPTVPVTPEPMPGVGH
jgi:beta-lactamase regulating signal transducer with metallopeptidase domain